MDPRHTPSPTQLPLFRQDLNESSVVTIVCRDRVKQDCHLAGQDRMSLVLEPSLAWTESGMLRTTSLDQVVQVEFNRGSRQAVQWVRDPNGLWLRLRSDE